MSAQGFFFIFIFYFGKQTQIKFKYTQFIAVEVVNGVAIVVGDVIVNDVSLL